MGARHALLRVALCLVLFGAVVFAGKRGGGGMGGAPTKLARINKTGKALLRSGGVRPLTTFFRATPPDTLTMHPGADADGQRVLGRAAAAGGAAAPAVRAPAPLAAPVLPPAVAAAQVAPVVRAAPVLVAALPAPPAAAAAPLANVTYDVGATYTDHYVWLTGYPGWVPNTVQHTFATWPADTLVAPGTLERAAPVGVPPPPGTATTVDYATIAFGGEGTTPGWAQDPWYTPATVYDWLSGEPDVDVGPVYDDDNPPPPGTDEAIARDIRVRLDAADEAAALGMVDALDDTEFDTAPTAATAAALALLERGRRTHYTPEFQDSAVNIFWALIAAGSSWNVALANVRARKGYEKLTQGMLRRWKRLKEERDAERVRVAALPKGRAKTKATAALKKSRRRGAKAGYGRAGPEFDAAVLSMLVVREVTGVVVGNACYELGLVLEAAVGVAASSAFVTVARVQDVMRKASARGWATSFLKRMGLHKRKITAEGARAALGIYIYILLYIFKYTYYI